MLYVPDPALKIKNMPVSTTPQANKAHCETFLQRKHGLESSPLAEIARKPVAAGV
jgi:hypothetical protein